MRQDRRAVSRRAVLGGIAGFAALPLVACGSDPRVQQAGLVRAKDVARVRPDASAPVGTATAGMVALGHALCAANAKPGANWVASPLSIASAFAMARVGALGATATSLDRFFGYPATGRDDAFNAITRSVVTTDGPPKVPAAPSSAADFSSPPIVTLGNALFAQQGLALRAAFLHALAAQYGAGVRTVDFTKSTAAAQINAWVSEETAGRIRKLFDSLDPSTQLVIANTVYLHARWRQIFGKYPTAAAPFARATGAPVSVAMMHDVEIRPYATGTGGWQALSMPYASGRADSATGENAASDLAMWLILPPPGGHPIDMLAPAILSEVAGSLKSVPVDVTVPKWNFANTIDLSQVMTAMGLDDVFGSGDFSGIAAGIGGVAGAVHTANITVDEFGTEAAAATGIAFATSGMMPPSTRFRADRPFAFTIVGGPSHVPLFSGVVSDPSA